ncbi:MAG: hypothetical protein ACK2UM_11665 [Anaerolineales bacterium]
MHAKIPFIPGKSTNKEIVLSRFLPQIPDGIATKWLADKFSGGSIVFDPFGTSPDFALDIARAGNLVISCVNNPITRMLFSIGANPAQKEQYRSALAELARCRVGNERLELHIKNLYRTNCNQCGQPIIADAFIWERGTNVPHTKIYDCPHCGDSGEHPISQIDIDLAQSFSSDLMNRMRIIERITSPSEKERRNVTEALSVYQPRALYALVTLINRLEGLLISPRFNEPVDPNRENCLVALIITALDRGNNLWSYPTGRVRPKQLSSSPHFKEINLWFVLEDAVEQLSDHQEPVEIAYYPDLPRKERGICIFNGPIRQLSDQFNLGPDKRGLHINAVISAIPRHNQAFWTLSALWAGWIWGHEMISDFKSVLLRRRYDWSWHCAALRNAFDLIKHFIEIETPILGIIPEAEMSFIQSTIVAAGLSGYKLNGITLRADKKQAQVHWYVDPQKPVQISAPMILHEALQKSVIQNNISLLNQRGEPAPYIALHTAALLTIANNSGISQDPKTPAADEFSRIQNLVENSLTYKNGFLRHGGSEKSLERSYLWHQQAAMAGNVLSDRVESQIFQLIIDPEYKNYHKIDQIICSRFPGMLTPDAELINHCIESYSSKESLESGVIVLREQDEPGRRSREVSEICLSLHDLGSKFGYLTRGENPVEWKTTDGDATYAFHVISTAGIGSVIFSSPYPPNKSIIVIPGARANLLLYKIRNNFILTQLVNKGWRFLKFRHFRHLLESPTINHENLDQELEIDPMTESPAQLRLL